MSVKAKCIECGDVLTIPMTDSEILQMAEQIKLLKYHVTNCVNCKFEKIEKIGIEECFRGDPEVESQ